MFWSLTFWLIPYKPCHWHHLWEWSLSCLLKRTSLLSYQKKIQWEWNCLWLKRISFSRTSLTMLMKEHMTAADKDLFFSVPGCAEIGLLKKLAFYRLFFLIIFILFGALYVLHKKYLQKPFIRTQEEWNRLVESTSRAQCAGWSDQCSVLGLPQSMEKWKRLHILIIFFFVLPLFNKKNKQFTFTSNMLICIWWKWVLMNTITESLWGLCVCVYASAFSRIKILSSVFLLGFMACFQIIYHRTSCTMMRHHLLAFK